MSKEGKVTLENYNYESNNPHLNSPISIRALNSLGIEEKELKKLSQKEYISNNPEFKLISEDLKNERYQNYLKKYEELINKAKEKRKELISEMEKEKKTEADKKSDIKIYHCELHNSESQNLIFTRGKSNPHCEICVDYEKKYEKMKERLKINIQLEIDNELLKLEKMRKQNNKHRKLENQEEKVKFNKIKDFENKREKEAQNENDRKKRQEDLRISIEKKRKEKEEKDKIILDERIKRQKEYDLEKEMNIKEKEKKSEEVRKNMESLNEEQMAKLLSKQKALEERDQKRKIKLEQLKINNSRNLYETYALKKDKVDQLLTDYDFQREEKNKRYFSNQKRKEERKAKYDKDLLMQRTMKAESYQKYKSDRLKRAIQLEEELNRRRLESYNKKLNKYSQTERNNNLNRQEKQKQNKLKEEENLKVVSDHRKKNEEILNENKIRYLDKIDKINERYLISKKNKDKEMKHKFNKIYINARNVNADYSRSMAAFDFQRKEKMDKINKRMNKLDKIMLEKQFHNMERQKLEEELNEEKQVMLNRLSKFLHSDKDHTKEEVYKYVFDGIKPADKDEKKEDNNNENENDYNAQEEQKNENEGNNNNNVDKSQEKSDDKNNKNKDEKSEEKKEGNAK